MITQKKDNIMHESSMIAIKVQIFRFQVPKFKEHENLTLKMISNKAN